MIRKIACLLLFLPLTLHIAAAADFEKPQIGAGAAILMDADTGQILYDKNIHQKEYPASLTKILTAVLALERGKLSDTVTMSDKAVSSLPRGASNIALVPGEKLSLEQALYATLLMSANEASNAVAEHIGGSLEAFAAEMNRRAGELGALGTNFVNPSGLSDDNHYTTAYDLAVITRHAIGMPEFLRIDGTITYTMQPTNMQPEPRHFANEQKMMKNTPYYYEEVFAGKTGYTSKAGHTLATAARKDGRTLICIILDGRSAQMPYEDTKTLLDYGFDNFQEYTLSKGEINAALAPMLGEAEQRAAVEADFSALIPAGAEVGDISMDLNDQKTAVSFRLDSPDLGEAAALGSLSLSYPALSEEARAAAVINETSREPAKRPLLSVILFVTAALLLTAALIYIRRARRIRIKRLRRQRYARRRYK